VLAQKDIPRIEPSIMSVHIWDKIIKRTSAHFTSQALKTSAPLDAPSPQKTSSPLDMEGFTHKPLDHTKSSIRLLRSLPPRGSRHFEIIHWTKGDKPIPYSCLSYMWGEDEPKYKIYINDRPLLIRRNLYKFLTTTYLTYDCSYMWIDALW
jgi:hypothetical protein